MRDQPVRASLTLLALALASCGPPPPARMTFYDITETTQAAVAAQLWLEGLAPCPAIAAGQVMRVGSLRRGELRLVEGTVPPGCEEHRYERCCGDYAAEALLLGSDRDEVEVRGPGLPEPLTRRGGLTRCEWDAWFDHNRRPDVAAVGSMQDGHLEADLFCVPPRHAPAEGADGDGQNEGPPGGAP